MTTTTSGAAAVTASQATTFDFSPACPRTSSPPAREIISGTQWPPA